MEGFGIGGRRQAREWGELLLLISERTGEGRQDFRVLNNNSARGVGGYGGRTSGYISGLGGLFGLMCVMYDRTGRGYVRNAQGCKVIRLAGALKRGGFFPRNKVR